MEQLLWLAIEGINGVLSWLTQLLEGIMPGREVHFWTIGLLGMIFFIASYLLVKLLRKIPFGDTVLSFLMALTFVSSAVLATGLDEVAAETGTRVLAQGATGLTGFLLLFFLYSIAALVLYISVKAIKKMIRRKKEEELIE